jgi:hypothetical protein
MKDLVGSCEKIDEWIQYRCNKRTPRIKWRVAGERRMEGAEESLNATWLVERRRQQAEGGLAWVDESTGPGQAKRSPAFADSSRSCSTHVLEVAHSALQLGEEKLLPMLDGH